MSDKVGTKRGRWLHRLVSVSFCFSRAVFPMKSQAAAGRASESSTTWLLCVLFSRRGNLAAEIAISCNILNAVSANAKDWNKQDAKPLAPNDRSTRWAVVA